VAQVEAILGQGVADSKFVEQYAAAEGEEIPLYSMTYADAYRRGVEALAARRPLCVINTPPVQVDIRVPRRRPGSFFDALDEGNLFNRSIQGAVIIQPPTFDERHTYDAVHYTDAGNELIFEMMREHLNS
jgi:hypothetical protein